MFLSDLAIRRPVFTTMAILAIIVFGIVSYPRLGVDMMPNVEFPLVTVVTVYPGADPVTVEREISEKLEDAVSTVNGVRNLRSTSVENVSQLIIEFELEIPADRAVQDVRDKVSAVVPTLPEDVEQPKVERFDLGAIPILQIAVGGPGTIDAVTRFARKQVKEQIQQVPGVGSIDIAGGQEREIRIWIDPEKLDAAGLVVTDVVGALKGNNLQFPGGRLTSGQNDFVVKVDGELENLKAIEELVIKESDGRPIRVSDVARVEDGLEERNSASRLDGQRAVTLIVRKQSGTNSVEVGERVKARLAETAEGFPKGWHAMVAADTTTFVKIMFEHVRFDIIFGGILAVIIVFFFLRNIRSTLIAAVALPTSVIGTLTFIYAMGFTFNTLTLLALSLSIGILIDDAIVVIENIFRHMEEGKTARKAAEIGTREIASAVFATTMSIVAVFIPVAFTRGIVGRFFYQFGLTVAVAVLISLFVSLTLTPMLSARVLRRPRENILFRVIEMALRFIDTTYRSMIGWALRHRLTTIFIALIAFGASLAIGGLFLKQEFMARFDMGEFNVVVKMPTGTSLEETEKVVEKVASQVRRLRGEVKSTVSSVGTGAQKKQNQGTIFVKLTDKRARAMSQNQIMSNLRSELPAAAGGATVSIEEANWMGGGGMSTTPVQFIVRGSDIEELDRATRKMVEELRKTPGFVDLDTSYEGGKPEVRVLIDRERAARLGISTISVGQTIRTMVGGVEASKFREKGEDYTIRVQLPQFNRREAGQLTDLKVRSQQGKLVVLSNVTRVEMGSGPAQIDRQARQRQITVLSNLESSLPLGEAAAIVKSAAARILPKTLTSSFEGMARIMKESFQNLLISLILAVLIVYMVLASQFESFIHPLTIMTALPMSLVGALGGLLLAKENMSIIAMIGIIMLMGLVTKNSILLIDYTNTLRRRDGLERNQALLRAGPTRLRPILMTTFAMIFGMLPVVLSRGYASEMRSPMGVCVIGGLIASTLLTLIVVPVVYTLFDDLGGLFRRKSDSDRNS
jgi:HAE1 family hydrophobic/amphiphilic exporter-1